MTSEIINKLNKIKSEAPTRINTGEWSGVDISQMIGEIVNDISLYKNDINQDKITDSQ